MQHGGVAIVRITVKSLLVLAALTSPALAGDGIPPVADKAITIAVLGHGGKVGTTPVGGWGPSLELSLGRKRLQYFVEGSILEERIGVEDDRISGHAYRGAAGLRWIARSFELGDKGAIDLHFEGFAGYSRLIFAGNHVGRPELGLGVGYQIRAFFKGGDLLNGFAFRISARVVFSPASNREETVACRGTCPMGSGDSTGLMAVFGAEL